MRKFLMYAVGIGILSYSCQYIYAAETIFPIDQYAKGVREFSGYQSFGTLQKRKFLKKDPCIITPENKTTYIVSPSCLVQPVSTGMSIENAISLLTPYIYSMNMVYDTSSSKFTYQATTPIFTKRLIPYSFTDELDIAFLASLQKQGIRVRILDTQLAYLMSKGRSWYAVLKDMTPLKPCTKQNYYVAFSSLQDYILKSGAQLNLNDMIAYRGGYCKGSGPKDLMFYGGVCGAATQLFRLSLLIPGIDVVNRHEHSIRYVPYYSEYVFGDDAALYQNSKKLILKNNSSSPLYLKTLDFGQSTYLIGIVPKRDTLYVEITKEQLDNLSSRVTKKVYVNQNMLIKDQEFLSNYVKKSYTVN